MPARNPGVIVSNLLWSMANGRPVRILLRDGAGVVTGQVVRCERDPAREELMAKTPKGKASSGASTVVAVLANGREVAVDSVQKVQKPHGDSGAVFMDGD